MTTSPNRAMPILIALLTALGPLGIDMYLPAIPGMASSLNTTDGQVQLSLMTFFMGLMLGQLFYGPLSDKFGRKPIIYIGLSISIVAGIGCALANSIEMLHALRFVQGLGGSIGMVIAFAIIKDVYQGPMIGKMMSMVLALLGLAPVLAPLVGNVLMTQFSWRAIFVCLALYAVVVLLACAKALPETRSVELREKFELSQTFKLYGKIFTQRAFIIYALSLCLAQAGFFAYIAGSASVLINSYGLSSTQFSLLFAVNALGLVVAAIVNPKLHASLGILKTFKVGLIIFAIDMLMLLVASLTGFASLPVFCITMFIGIAVLGFIMPTGTQLTLMQQGQHAGTASALLGSMQFGFGAFVSALTGAFAAQGALGLITIMCGCAVISLVLAMLLLPKKLSFAE